MYDLTTTNVIIPNKTYSSTDGFYYMPENESENLTLSNLTSTFLLAKLFAQSRWNVFDERYLRHSLGATFTITIICIAILVIGVVGNCTVIFILLRDSQMRSVTNMFILNLAVADLLVVMFYVPVKFLMNVFKPWMFGPFTCKCFSYIQVVSISASAYSLVAISLVRCRAVYRSFGQIRLSTSQTIKLILIIWITAALILSPSFVIFDIVISERDRLPHCMDTWENKYYSKMYYVIVNLIFSYCVPLLLISISSGIICWRVTFRPVPNESAATDIIKKMHQKARNHIRRMLAIVILTFLVSWLPLHVIVTRMKFSSDVTEYENSRYKILLTFAEMLGSVNSCVSPVLYAFLNKEFRESIQSVLPSPLRPNRRRESLASMCMVSYGVTASNIGLPGMRYQINGRFLHSGGKRYSEACLKPYNYQYQRHRYSYPNLPMQFLQPGSQQISKTPSPSKSCRKDFGFDENSVSKTAAGLSQDDITKD